MEDELNMALFEIGRVCIKNRGREIGKKCVVIDVIDKNYVLVTGPREVTGVKKRRVNVGHLEPLQTKLAITKGIDDKEVGKALKETLPDEFPEKNGKKEKKKIETEKKPEEKQMTEKEEKAEVKKSAKPEGKSVKKEKKPGKKRKSVNE